MNSLLQILLDQVYANWIPGQLPPTLNNLTFEIEAGTLCGIAGPVGSGKTGILNLLLGELALGAGSIVFREQSSSEIYESPSPGFHVEVPNLTISYASQNPWLFSGTVRDNILFDQPFDAVKYNEVKLRQTTTLLNLLIILFTSSSVHHFLL